MAQFSNRNRPVGASLTNATALPWRLETLVAGLEAFAAGEHRSAVELLWNARPHLMLLGGSYTQRDVIDWTMIEAAIRAGMKSVAVALTNGRIALRPESLPNKRFLAEVEKLAV